MNIKFSDSPCIWKIIFDDLVKSNFRRNLIFFLEKNRKI